MSKIKHCNFNFSVGLFVCVKHKHILFCFCLVIHIHVYMSYSGPRTAKNSSLASGKLPTRRICLSPVSAISTSKVAGLGRNSLLYYGGSASYTSLWPALTGHTILISEQSNIYPFWDLQHNPHIHLNTLINPYCST